MKPANTVCRGHTYRSWEPFLSQKARCKGGGRNETLDADLCPLKESQWLCPISCVWQQSRGPPPPRNGGCPTFSNPSEKEQKAPNI